MRIARLDLHAFGPFTKASLHFDAQPDVLQLVYGPNEAGKTSALRALTALFYGVPVRTGDAHVHDMTRLRVGARLLDHEGRAIELLRRKGAKHTLLDLDEQPLDDALMRGLLGGLDEALFRQMFGLDHEHLRAGGDALLRGQGQLGESLFSAGTGARGISQLIASLREEIELLYKPRGRTPRLNAALDSLSACQRRLRDAMLSPKAFREQQVALAQARTAREAALAERHALLAERARLERQLALLPLLHRRAVLRGELEKLIARDDARDDDTGLSAVVQELERRRGAVLGFERELPHKRALAELLERELAELKTRLGDAADGLRALETPIRVRLRRHADEERALIARHAELVRQVAQHDEALVHLDKDDTAHDAASLSRLAELVELCDRSGLARELSRERSELAKQEAQLARAAAQLGVRADAAELVRLVLPEDAQVAELEARAERSERDAERLAESMLRATQQLEQLTHARTALLREGSLPTLDDLDAARAERDDAFTRLLEAGVADATLTAEVRAAIARADALADQLRRDARRVAQRAQLSAQIEAQEVQRAQVCAEAKDVEAARAALIREAEQLTAPLGLTAVPPRALRPLLARLAALVARASELEAARAASATSLSRALALTRLLVGDSAEAVAPEPQGEAAALAYERALEAARAQLARLVERARDYSARRARRDELIRQRAAAVAERDELVARLEAFRAAYREDLAGLGFARELAPDEVLACVDDLALYSQKSRELSLLRTQLEAHEGDRRALDADVRQAVARYLGESAALDLDAALAALARLDRERLATLRDLVQLRAERARLNEQLTALGDGRSDEALEAEVAGMVPLEARARLAELEPALEVSSERIGELDQTIGRLSGGLEILEQTAGASATAEELESELSRARALARRYYEARVALAILQREIERYREAHQGPVLARASALFPRLTLSRYRGLRVEYDERDEPVLACVRHDGTVVHVDGLSDGTRDQLYFALRIASIERFVETNPALPLILDDAFIHFDDARASAALEVLAELAQRAQVVFFTHHARIVELALRALGPGQVALHRLPPPSGVHAVSDDGPLFAGMI